MTAPNRPAVPPDVAHYLAGAPPEAVQFAFLLGSWDVAGTRWQRDGSVALAYRASWEARTINDGRMIVDEFKAYAPGGAEVSCFVTLRTYSPQARRWEIAGLPSLQAANASAWHGQWTGDEMVLEADVSGPQGQAWRNRIRFFAIAADAFSWDSHLCEDGGGSWFKVASLQARRRAV